MDTDSLLTLVDEHKSGNSILLVFSDSRYLTVLMNWLVSVDRLGVNNYVVISLDRDIHQFLQSKGIPTFLSIVEGDLSRLWIRRMEIFRQVCAHGVDFVHSDIDAVWLRDPTRKYFDDSECHVVASQGTIWPPDVLRKRGFVFCCGLFYIRNGTETEAMLEEIERDVRVTGDDQISFNRVVESYDVDWQIDTAHSYALEYSGYRFRCSRELIEGGARQRNLRFALLPHHLFQRLPVADPHAYVKHLLSHKTASSKIQMFAATGCLFLRPDWQSVPFTAGSLQLLRRDLPHSA